MTLTAHAFQPGSVVDIWMHSTQQYLGLTIADVTGIAVLPIVLTPDLAGSHHVQAIGTGLLGEPRNLAQPIMIVAESVLASTGVDTAVLLPLGLLMLLSGATVLGLLRRRA